VELHQASTASSDAGFDCNCLDLALPKAALPHHTRPGANFQGTALIPLEAFARAPVGASVSKVEFFANGVKLGEGLAAPYR